MAEIRVIATGGTFDKRYDAIAGKLGFAGSHLPEILEQVRLAESAELEINQLIDSLEMGAEQRFAVLQACKLSPQDRIVITHGTDTMVETAAVIGEAGLDKTIVLTGAMVPYSVVGSDALFNLGFAFAAVRIASRGVWIAMNGQLFAWDKVQKNRIKGIFEEIK